jgi:CheY-like chemotaxis protein
MSTEAWAYQPPPSIPPDLPRVLLVNTNPFFANAVAFSASRRQLSLVCWDGTTETLDRLLVSEYDVVVIDLTFTGHDAAEIAAMLCDKPVVFTCDQTPSFATAAAWPLNVKRFIARQRGVEAILDAAMDLHDA